MYTLDDKDLQDTARRDDAYETLNEIIYSLTKVNAFPALTWVYVWDIVKDKLDYYCLEKGEEYAVRMGLTEKEVFDMLWEDADKQGFSLEYGTEQLHDAIFDWMIERDILVVYDQDGWLE